MSQKPVLIFGYGNPSRADDALGPEYLTQLEIERDEGTLPPVFDTLTDFQLQIEHALDLEARRIVLFVDASGTAQAPFEFSRLQASQDDSYTTHAMSPASVLAVFNQISSNIQPSAFLLSIAGYDFELGRPLSEKAELNLKAAIEFTHRLLNNAEPDAWQELADK
jgi:hydrogenase maturation protease